MDTTTIDIFSYLDYREFLKDFCRGQKQRHFFFSLRYIAQKTGVDAAHVARVLAGQRHLSEKSLPGFITLCNLDGKEKEFFEALFVFNTAKTDRQSKTAFESLLSIGGVGSKALLPNQYEFYSKWYYTAVRALIAIHPFKARGDFGLIAAMLSPSIDTREAKDAVALLLRLGLVVVGADGYLVLTDKHVTTGPQWRSLAVGNFQDETLHLACESRERHAKDLRDISTVTVGISRSQLPELRERIAEFRTSIIRLAEENQSPDDVYQLNVQLFPLSNTGKRKPS